MNKIQVLDCTLRDGGYVNNWNFGAKNIETIINNLINSKIDYIECGFFKKNTYEKNKSIFTNIEELMDFLPQNSVSNKFTLMINQGDYDVKKIKENSNNLIFRIAFKKENINEALNDCSYLVNKGYNILIAIVSEKNYASINLHLKHRFVKHSVLSNSHNENQIKFVKFI
jgi:4-hydroxy 2-oxovalerate aldolase